MKKYIAEGFGTFVLTLVVALSFGGYFALQTPVLAALTVALFVYAVGHISGAHLNPAVTIGLWSIKKIDHKQMFGYFGAQFLGAIPAMYLANSVYHLEDFFSVQYVTLNEPTMVAIAEFTGMFLYAFLLGAFAYGRIEKGFSGIYVGSSLLFGIVIATMIGSGGFINPAVAFGFSFPFGIDSLSLIYVFAPLLGGVLGMQAYKYLDR